MKNWASRITSLVFCTSAIAFCANAAPGLIHQWSGEGDANDSVGGANGSIVATDTNGSPGVTFTAGQVGQAFNFDGTGYVDCGTNQVAAFGDSDFAIAFWVKGNGPAALISKSSYGIGYDISLNAGGTIACNLQGSNDALNVTSLSRVDDGGFHHVVVERNNTNLYVFIDGNLSGKSIDTQIIDMPEIPYVLETNQIALYQTNADTGDLEPMLDGDGNPMFTNEVDVASAPATFQFGAGFVGLLDEIQVYPRALTAFEVYSVTHPGVGLAFIDQPLNQRGLAGRPILLHCLVVGQDPITYQWQFNGLDIPGANANNLVLDSPQTFDSGTYDVVVSNPSGDLVSQLATLMITNLATPTAGLVSRWSGEGTANDSFGVHNGVTSNIKYVPGVLGTAFQFNGTSSVRCGNVLGNIGDFTVDFWMQTSQMAPQGNETGIPIVGQRPYCSAIDLFQLRLMGSGAGFDDMQVELGDYRNGFNPAHNYVGISSALSSFHLNDGVFHHVATTRSSNVLSLYIDGTFISSVPSHDPCVLDGVGSFDMGIGVCGNSFIGSLDEVEVFNRALSDNEIFNSYSPSPNLSIVRQPKSVSAAENSAASLTVSAAGLDPITFQWQLNGSDIAGATDSAYTLASAQLSDAGVYTVRVSNPIKTIVSSPAQLTVVPASSILPGLINRFSAEGNYADSMGNCPWGVGQSSFAPGVSGQAWKFDGVYSIVGLAYDTGAFGYDDFTWAMWVRYEKDGTLLSKMPAYRFAATGGKIQVQFGDGSRNFSSDWFIMGDANAGSWFTTAPVQINDGNFHHVAIARQDQTNLIIYIDGTNALQAVMPAFNLNADWGIAFCDDWGRYPRFGGVIDEAEDYNRALTPDEVMSLYTKYANGPRGGTSTLGNITAAIGSTLMLNAGSISGSGPVSYQWTLNGVAIAGATDSTFNGVVDTSSPGIYAVTMTTPDGSISSPIARVSIQLAPGSYNGLFYLDTDVTDESAGYITLTLDINQTYSASIMQKGKTYKGLTGKFAGTSTVLQVNRGPKSPLMIELSGITSNKISGVVHDAARKIPLEAHRAVYDATHPTPQAGSYTLQMTGLITPNAPNGHGFGNVTIAPNGQMKFIANLADDTVVSQNALFANAGVWPLYIPHYAGKGSVLGWMSFTNNTGSVASGTLRWIKSAAPGSKNYKRGFATRIPAIASTFTPQGQGLGIGLNNSSMVSDGAKVYNPVTDPILGITNNTITFTQQVGTKTAKGTLKVVPNTGRFSGNFVNPITKKIVPIKGIVMQNQSYAAGYFFTNNLSGRVVLQHN